jgi:hypothetical protein
MKEHTQGQLWITTFPIIASMLTRLLPERIARDI